MMRPGTSHVLARLIPSFAPQGYERRGILPRVAIVAFILAICGMALYLGYRTETLGVRTVTLDSDEFDLTTDWKVKLGDVTGFADPAFDDSSWRSTVGRHVKLDEAVDDFKEGWILYRRTVTIATPLPYSRPTLYLRGINQYGEVYWDGNLIGSTRGLPEPVVSLLPDNHLSVGTHVLAVRAYSATNYRPGIGMRSRPWAFIGRYDKAAAHTIEAYLDYGVEPGFSAGIEASALFLLLFALLQAGRINERSAWLVLQLCSSMVLSLTALGPNYTNIRGLFVGLSFTLGSFAAMGYATALLQKHRPVIWLLRVAGGSLFAYAIYQLSARYISGASYSRYESLGLQILNVVAFATVVFVTVASVVDRWQRGRASHPWSTFVILGGITMLQFSRAIDSLREFVPWFTILHIPLQHAFLTTVISASTLLEHIRNEKLLAFYGRFIRPGLKQLVAHNREQGSEAQVWQRGRRIPLLKVDIVGFTAATYGMPYGFKRLYQHLWISHVDQTTAELTFLDKSDGDGSIYCFDNNKVEKPCTAAMNSVFQIQRETIARFDAAFKEQARAMCTEIPHVVLPWRRFLAGYERRNKTCFHDRKTEVRFILLYGFVDEGLWGIKSQSHYDVQGDLLILLARLEKLAGAGQLIVSEEFLAQWAAENVGTTFPLPVKWRSAELPGVGLTRYGIANLDGSALPDASEPGPSTESKTG